MQYTEIHADSIVVDTVILVPGPDSNVDGVRATVYDVDWLDDGDEIAISYQYEGTEKVDTLYVSPAAMIRVHKLAPVTMRTPQLVREYADARVRFASGRTTKDEHERHTKVVIELRSRGILD